MRETEIIRPVKYEDKKLIIIDQTLLPNQEKYISLETREDVFRAIKNLEVRGAPAIGVTAAYGIALDLQNIELDTKEKLEERFAETKEYLEHSRPTAVNLFWALNRMEKRLQALATGLCINQKQEIDYIKEELIAEAIRVNQEDITSCYKMGEYGLSLLTPNMGILTHCNAGTLATSKYGTCIAPIYLGEEKGYRFKVYADETRPVLQGARLTSFELAKGGVDVTLICDNMAATVMKEGLIDAVLVGCDRMAANGDGANKIGTLQVAILAKEYGIPFYMFVPTSTIDLETKTGEDIIIEQREGEEISHMWYKEPMALDEVKKLNPAFDVTDHKYITAIITDKGIIYPPFSEKLSKIQDQEI